MLNECRIEGVEGRGLEVLRCKRGYILGRTGDNGEVVCQATRYYRDRKRAEIDLKARTFIPREYCSYGCCRCIYSLKVGSWGVVDEELPAGVRHYYFYIKSPDFTELGKLMRDSEVVFDVYFNHKVEDFERIIVHDGFMNKFDYELNELEKDRVFGWVKTVGGIEIK